MDLVVKRYQEENEKRKKVNKTFLSYSKGEKSEEKILFSFLREKRKLNDTIVECRVKQMVRSEMSVLKAIFATSILFLHVLDHALVLQST